MKSAARRFLGDRRGNIAMIFACSAAGICAVGGGAMDFARMYNLRAGVQYATDAAALTLARDAKPTDTDLDARAEVLVTDLLSSRVGEVNDVTATATSTSLTVTSTVQMPTTFLNLIGMSELNTEIESTAVWGLGIDEQATVEIALVLDNTGSMLDDDKFTSLKSAATTMVTTMQTKITGVNQLKFALVPFANFVNVGTSNASASWMDTQAKSSIHSTYFTGLNRFTLYSNLGKSWPGCVETRPSPYDVSDATPATGTPDTLFVPSFHPDEPDGSSWGSPLYANNYMNDKTNSSNDWTRMTNVSKYSSPTGLSFSNSSYYSNYAKPKGPGFFCDTRPIMPLTTDFSSINTAINAMEAAGSTNIPEGLAWGWRVLSSGLPFDQGRAKTDEANSKIIVLLTDGTNSVNTPNRNLGSAYSSWGYSPSGRLGNNPGTNLRNGLDAKLNTICSNVKGDDIEVYTIGLMINDSATQTMLSNCSSGAGYYYNSPNAAQLQSIFDAIAAKIIMLRLAS